MLNMPWRSYPRAPDRKLASNSNWTEPRIALLRKLHADGLSYSEIADEMGVTRNAVSGKIDRIGLGERRGARRRYVTKPRKPKKVSFRVKALLARANDPKVEGEPLEPATPAPPTFLGLTLLELTENTCRYPRGDGPFFFCGVQPVHPGSAYCAGCTKICLNPKATAASAAKGAVYREMGHRYHAALRDAPP